MKYYHDTHRTKYMWNSVIVEEDYNNWVAFLSHKTMEEAEAWGEGFIKAIEMLEMLEMMKNEGNKEKDGE